jgi:glyceraldehyde-3-phosphate dehydrogenase (NAD(P))
MIRVGVNGYGTIGKRVADAVHLQPDMELVGVAKTRPNYEAKAAVQKGYALYTAIPEQATSFVDAGIDLHGEVTDLISESDVIVDATPAGVGAENCSLYEAHETPAILQGGESPETVDESFVAQANYDKAAGADLIRVVSCNTTGLSRLLEPLDREYGIEKVRATLIRRGGDPGETDRGPINDILPDPITLPSHHGPDVRTIFPNVDIDTLGVTVPATLMHLHSVNFTLETTPSVKAIADLLSRQSRLFVVPAQLDIDGTAKLKEFAKDVSRPRGDLWENCLWKESIAMEGNDLYLFQSIHQEANVVPENIDAIRAIVGRTNAAKSIALTNDHLRMGISQFISKSQHYGTTLPTDD